MMTTLESVADTDNKPTRLQPPPASAPAVRKVMQANRKRDTRPELAVRKAAHRLGLRYRVDVRPLLHLARRADMIFSKRKVAVFIDGCWWHGCPQHYKPARTNSGYWTPKIARNMERDRETDRLLNDAGWHVIRAWEHEDPYEVASRIAQAVGSPDGPGAKLRSLRPL